MTSAYREAIYELLVTNPLSPTLCFEGEFKYEVAGENQQGRVLHEKIHSGLATLKFRCEPHDPVQRPSP